MHTHSVTMRACLAHAWRAWILKYDMIFKPLGDNWGLSAESESEATACRWWMTTNIVNKRTACSPNNPAKQRTVCVSAWTGYTRTCCLFCRYINVLTSCWRHWTSAKEFGSSRNFSSVLDNISCRLFIAAILYWIARQSEASCVGWIIAVTSELAPTMLCIRLVIHTKYVTISYMYVAILPKSYHVGV